MFTVGLIDRISGPAARATRSFDGLITTAKGGFEDMRSGAMGLAATGFLIYESLTPAIEMNRALGEVESLGVLEGDLQTLNDAALNFSATYGSAADEFVRASYDIQSAIAGLTGDELSAFTSASAVLAKGTKSDVGTITSYMGTMYGVFKNTAAEMGNANWVEMVSGQTATAVKMFKTTGSEMASAFGALGASATAMGVSMHEQMAVLGTLQATMSGSEAATKYTAFISGAVAAQDKLGVSLFDASGNMKSMTDIMGILQREIGHLDKAAQFSTLKNAFGSEEAVKLIQLMMADTDGLTNSINELGKVTGMDQASKMAESMVDPWQQLGSAVQAVRVAMGQALLPVIEPVIQWFADMAKEVLLLIKLFPNITKVITTAGLVIMLLAASMATLTIAVGLGKAAWAGWLMVMQVASAVTKVFTAIQWLLNAAFTASPIGLIVLGITALAMAFFMAWQGIKLLWDIFKESSAGQFLLATLGNIINWFKSLGGMVDWVIDKLNMIPGLSIGVDTGSLNGMVDQEVGKLNMIPEVNIGTDTTDMTTELAYRKESATSDVPAGGVTSQISKSIADNSTQSTTINIQTTEPITPQYVQDQLWQAAP